MVGLTLTLPSRTPGRIAVLDELKGLAILLIVLYHAGGVLSWANRLHGELGVDIFVMLSGVGLALSRGEGGLGHFFARRFSRIYPSYWIVLTGFLAADSYILNRHYTPTDITVHYLGIHALFGDKYAVSINDSFWFITMIVFVYVIYGFARRLMRNPAWLIAIGSIVSLTTTLIFLKEQQAVCFSHFGARLPTFFLGILLGQLTREGVLELPFNWLIAVSLFILFYVGYLEGVIFYSTFLAPLVMALYAFGWRQLIPGPLVEGSGRILAFLGRHSLEIFLLHQPLIREYNYYSLARWFKVPAPNELQLIIGMSVAFGLTILLSILLQRVQRMILRTAPAAS